jgi:chloramphenicol 3-O-phosphotransferase
LQSITWPPFLHVQLDTFTQMLPTSFREPAGGSEQTPESTHLTFAKTDNIDEIVSQTRRGMRHAVAAMAAQGLHLREPSPSRSGRFGRLAVSDRATLGLLIGRKSISH